MQVSGFANTVNTWQSTVVNGESLFCCCVVRDVESMYMTEGTQCTQPRKWEHTHPRAAPDLTGCQNAIWEHEVLLRRLNTFLVMACVCVCMSDRGWMCGWEGFKCIYVYLCGYRCMCVFVGEGLKYAHTISTWAHMETTPLWCEGQHPFEE